MKTISRAPAVRALPLGAFGAVLALLLVLIPGGLASASDAENLLLNSNLSAGTTMPDDWHPSRREGCESFQWLHPKGASAELRIVDAPGNDAAWTQEVSVTPGWYYLSADIRVEGDQPGAAFLAVKQGGRYEAAVWRNQDWARNGFYIRVESDHPLEVQCGLASPVLRTKVSCRNITLVRTPGVPPAGARQFELRHPASHSGGAINWISVWLLVLLGVSGFTYYRYSDDEASAASTSHKSRLRSDLLGLSPKASRDAVILSFALLLVGIMVLSRVDFIPGHGFTFVTPAAVRSDEPHYIMVINSLLFDHDFELQDDYERVAQGGLDAGARFQRHELDHHTLLVNRRTGHHAFASIDSPNSVAPCDPEFTSSDDVYEVSAHPPGFPILMALALAPFRPAMSDVESDAAIILALVSWLGALVTYWAGRSAGMGRAKAMLAVFLLMGASTWLAYSRSFFSEATIGLALILALWALIADRPILAGLTLAFAAFLKPPFAIIGIAFIINEIAGGRRQNAIKIAIVLAACGIPVMLFNYWLALTPVISGNSSWIRGASFQSLYDTFLEPGHGLLYFVPWSIIAFITIASAFLKRHSQAEGKLLRQMGLPIVLYLALLSCSGTGPGLCYGPRYWVPFLPWFALATADSLSRARRPALIACGVLVALAVLIAIPGALRYPDIFSRVPWAAWQAG
jgi:hypothetical protein